MVSGIPNSDPMVSRIPESDPQISEIPNLDLRIPESYQKSGIPVSIAEVVQHCRRKRDMGGVHHALIHRRHGAVLMFDDGHRSSIACAVEDDDDELAEAGGGEGERFPRGSCDDDRRRRCDRTVQARSLQGRDALLMAEQNETRLTGLNMLATRMSASDDATKGREVVARMETLL